MNGAPDWQDGECCFRCRIQFSIVVRKHHCRNCGNIFCTRCSSKQIPLPKLNIEKSVRVCEGCYDKLSKNDDNLVLAQIKTSDGEQTKTKTAPKSSASSSSTSSKSSSNKPAANASAPSEQELKEEEELQLALALSLSEAPVKVSFPDCRQLEEANYSSSTPNAKKENDTPKVNNFVQPKIDTSQMNSSSEPQPPQYVDSTPEKKQQQVTGSVSMQQDQTNSSKDQELFNFVAEVQSTAEVFANRVNSNKLRNRPIADDTAIQTLFLKLSNMHTRLLEYIKVHEDERSGFEAIQDKLSQIADARAALDALREEHQEKIRQEAAEAERLRQSQLASKLEMMRQKKSQMMQYQRDLALQRIQQQAMLIQQPQGVSQPKPPVVNSFQSGTLPGTSEMHVPSAMIQEQPQQPTMQQQQPPNHTQLQQFTTQPSILQDQIQQAPPALQGPVFNLPNLHTSMQASNQLNQNIQQQYDIPTVPKVEDEAPLISFDD